MDQWFSEVDAYLEHLSETARSIAMVYVSLQTSTRRASPDEITHEVARLGGLVNELNDRLTLREQLLLDYPVAGVPAPDSLQEALASINHTRASTLLKRSQGIAAQIDEVTGKGLGLFIGQFHLVNMTEEMLRLMFGASAQKSTYDQHDDLCGGGLFDRAA